MNHDTIMESGVRSQESGVRSQESGVRPVVSFCIPCYNRVEVTVELIKGILISDDSRFEVVVRDNASTDNTPEILSQIDDPRFRYVRGDKAVSPAMNWLKALELGRGDWIFLVISRDRIRGEYIPKLIDYLERAEKEGINYLHDGYSRRSRMLIYSGIDAMIKFLPGMHPTGKIYKRDYFKEIPTETREYYFTTFKDLGPAYMTRDLLLKGKGAFIMSGVYHWADTIVDTSTIKSTFEYGKDLHDVWYAPKQRTRLLFRLIDMVELETSGRFTKKELDKYFCKKFSKALLGVSLQYRITCSKPQFHYGQQAIHIGIPEMLRNIWKCYKDTKAYLIENGTYSRSRQIIMCTGMLKISLWSLIWGPTRSMMEKSGIWDALRFAKHKILRK